MAQPDTTDAKAFARALMAKAGVSPSFAHELATGKRKPSLPMAVKIEDAMKIPPRWWVDREAA